MNINKVQIVDHILMESGGRIVLPETVMKNVVMETPGGDLWFNDVDVALGIRLLRGNDAPPYRIERLTDENGSITGVLDAGSFLAKVGQDTELVERVTLPVYYFAQYHMLTIPLKGQTESEPARPRGVLDDFPALED